MPKEENYAYFLLYEGNEDTFSKAFIYFRTFTFIFEDYKPNYEYLAHLVLPLYSYTV